MCISVLSVYFVTFADDWGTAARATVSREPSKSLNDRDWAPHIQEITYE